MQQPRVVDRVNIDEVIMVVHRYAADRMLLDRVARMCNDALTLIHTEGFQAKVQLSQVINRLRGMNEAFILTGEEQRANIVQTLWQTVMKDPLARSIYGDDLRL